MQNPAAVVVQINQISKYGEEILRDMTHLCTHIVMIDLLVLDPACLCRTISRAEACLGGTKLKEILYNRDGC